MWFALAAVLLAVIVAGYYAIAKYRFHVETKVGGQKLDLDIEQSTQGFSLSKSEGGRTLFKISAKKARQLKSTGRAELEDVSIVVYGRDSNRFDQIYGAHFEYDSKSGIAEAKGEVEIDLEANSSGPARPDQAAPEELKNPIHLKTSGLIFNRNTGIAHTSNTIEFRIPQAAGSARGVTYDSHANQLTLQSEIQITSSTGTSTTIHANRAVIFAKEPREAVLENVRVEQPDKDVTAGRVFLYFRNDNTIDRVVAVGGVQVVTRGKDSLQLRAPGAELLAGMKNQMKAATFSGGAQFVLQGNRPMQGSANQIALSFGSGNKLASVKLSGDATVVQEPAAGSERGERTTMKADAVEFLASGRSNLSRAETSGAASVWIEQPPQGTQQTPTKTRITASRFVADFDSQSRLRKLLGEPNARIVSSSEGQVDRTASSDRLEMEFNPRGGLATLVQQGNFRYHETLPGDQGTREAYADLAHYNPATETFLLSRSPRMVEGGVTITGNTLRINRKSGEAVAEGNVKSTYSRLKPQPGGAMLASAEPIHVTARKMVAQRGSGTALYTGGARLWQGANVVEAAQIEFDRERRSLVAQGAGQSGGKGVTSVFVQQDKSGRVTPVNVVARKLTYADADRRARYEGGVVARSADTSLTAAHVDILLKKADAVPADPSQLTPSQLERIVAENGVVVQQPNRRATGSQLTYFADDGRFVLQGGPPLITDLQRGSIRGDSLTFFSRDDRVLVEGSDTAPAITHTRVK